MFHSNKKEIKLLPKKKKIKSNQINGKKKKKKKIPTTNGRCRAKLEPHATIQTLTHPLKTVRFCSLPYLINNKNIICIFSLTPLAKRNQTAISSSANSPVKSENTRAQATQEALPELECLP
jgi:hypothetical protein